MEVLGTDKTRIEEFLSPVIVAFEFGEIGLCLLHLDGDFLVIEFGENLACADVVALLDEDTLWLRKPYRREELPQKLRSVLDG